MIPCKFGERKIVKQGHFGDKMSFLNGNQMFGWVQCVFFFSFYLVIFHKHEGKHNIHQSYLIRIDFALASKYKIGACSHHALN